MNYEYINSNDCFKKFNTTNSNVDLNVVIKLYQPLIGYKSVILYLTLINLVESEKFKHEFIFNIMQINAGDFLIARKSLEACGLLKTYVKNHNDSNEYTYILYSPKSPKDFFDDILFKSLFVKYIGKQEANKIASFFKLKFDSKKIKKLNDITVKFNDVFSVKLLDDDSFNVKMPIHLKNNQIINADTNFSFGDFFNYLKKNMISPNSLTKKDCIEIERISTLYGLNVLTAADIISQIYNENDNNHVDLSLFLKKAIYYAKFSNFSSHEKEKKKLIRISGKTIFADKIRMMEVLSPKLFLQTKQNGIPLITADLKLINYLSEVMQLNNSVINAIIDYCLRINNNRFTRDYVEKIASSVKRANVNNALDTLNYLEMPFSQKKEKFKKIVKNKNEKNNYDELEYDKLIKSIDDKNVKKN